MWYYNNKLLLEPRINGNVGDDNRYNDTPSKIYQSEVAPTTPPEPEPIPTEPYKPDIDTSTTHPKPNHDQVESQPPPPPEEKKRFQRTPGKHKAPPLPNPTIEIEQPVPEPPQLNGPTTQPAETPENLLTIPQNHEGLSRSSSESSLVNMIGNF